jgi:hypothetical protein
LVNAARALFGGQALAPTKRYGATVKGTDEKAVAVWSSTPMMSIFDIQIEGNAGLLRLGIEHGAHGRDVPDPGHTHNMHSEAIQKQNRLPGHQRLWSRSRDRQGKH